MGNEVFCYSLGEGGAEHDLGKRVLSQRDGSSLVRLG